MQLRRHDRYDFVPLPDRPVYDWPGGKRLAVAFCNNIEWFAFMEGLGSDHTQPGAAQTTRNYAWRDYGNRVGLWYLMDMFDDLGLPLSHNINAQVLEHAPQITARLTARGDEIIGHGRTNSERQDVLARDDEATLINETTEAIRQAFGTGPKGWLGPYIVQSQDTPELLKRAGYDYTLDWPADDQPFWMRTDEGPLLSVPYSIEINDSPAQVFRHHTGDQFEQMMIDQFDEMLHQSRRYPLVYTAVLHPFVIGQPFRLRALRRAVAHILQHRDDIWIATPGQIAAHVMGLPKGTLPGD